MLSQLYIENIAVIEKSGITFHPGLNVLTGETGAGKSIVIDSINAILGERTSREIIRSGAQTAFVSATFSDAGPHVLDTLRSLGYEPEDDGTLLIQREINLDGKAVCRINGRPATVSILKQIGVSLINIHGQHESFDLLSPDLHIHYIDRIGAFEELLTQYHTAYEDLKRVKSELDSYNMDEEQKSRRIDLLKYQIDELEAVDLHVGEQQELTEQRTMYLNSEKIASSINMAKSILDGDENSDGALTAISNVAGALADTERYLPSLSTLTAKLKEISYSLEDCSEELRGFSSQLEYNPAELENIENRLDTIYRLSLKYGESEEIMLDFLDKCRAELNDIELSDETILKLTNQYQAAKEEAVRLAKEISRRRKAASDNFAKKVKAELKFLDMPGIDFEVEQERCPLNALGCDKIQFLISTNPGEPAKPIAKIASGGELSRIMLAIKTVLADKDEIDTLIFDEVDTGISGSAAQKVGLKLREAANNRQVICVTHLAQIAALAGSHLLIEKHVKANKTYTDVTPLDFDGRKKELARIMGGTRITPLMLENAEEMLKMAEIKSESLDK
ncbi:MAG TPA: DNA repair protein RecN [Oscillospiraceae bacterium]|nr:DNA repair protein RecN [Oscillospiraceae bacterium]